VAHVVIAGAADADAAAIADDLAAKVGANVAARYDADFDAFYQRLKQFPESAPPRKLGATVRIGVVFPYVVFYRYVEADDAVFVLRVLHGRRKITRRMLQQPPTQP
jgi:toxin ParE1/3/4